MGKLILQFVLIVGSFFGVWFLLSQIHYVDGDDVQKFAKANERQLGTLILRAIRSTGKESRSEELKSYVDSIGSRVCEKTNLPFDSVKVHIIRNSEVNAFALPDHHMVIYTGLIEDASNAEEVAGVMAHEIAHMEKSHVMKKLAKEVGLSVLFAVVGGDAGREIVRQIAHTLSSSAFDRTQEQEADDYAVDAMANANIDPENLANFLFRLSQRADDVPDELIWLSTHPDSKERASEILKKKKLLKFDTIPVLKTPWKEVQKFAWNSRDEEEEN
jgi:beta-barrel assembly-enhancing protease